MIVLLDEAIIRINPSSGNTLGLNCLTTRLFLSTLWQESSRIVISPEAAHTLTVRFDHTDASVVDRFTRWYSTL